MSNRGTQSLREYEWRRDQRRQGYKDGLKGKQGGYSDQYYQRGWREGKRRAADVAYIGLCTTSRSETDHMTQCPNLGHFAYKDPASGEVVRVCGIHAGALLRDGVAVYDRLFVRRQRAR